MLLVIFGCPLLIERLPAGLGTGTRIQDTLKRSLNPLILLYSIMAQVMRNLIQNCSSHIVTVYFNPIRALSVQHLLIMLSVIFGYPLLLERLPAGLGTGTRIQDTLKRSLEPLILLYFRIYFYRKVTFDKHPIAE